MTVPATLFYGNCVKEILSIACFAIGFVLNGTFGNLWASLKNIPETLCSQPFQKNICQFKVNKGFKS
jgi:hypothetical protein